MKTISHGMGRAMRAGLFRLAGLLLLGVSLHAAAQPVDAVSLVPFDAAANTSLKKIVLLKSSMPNFVAERVGGIVVFRSGENPAAATGGWASAMVGPLVSAGMPGPLNRTQLNSREVAARFKALDFDANEWFTTRVKEALERNGYEVRVSTVERPLTNPAPKFEGIARKDEAVLDLGTLIPMLYWGEKNTRYLPRMMNNVKLVRVDDQTVLYRNTIVYAPIMSPSAKTILVDPKYAFESFEAILANDKLAVEGFQVGLAAFTERIAAELKRAEP